MTLSEEQKNGKYFRKRLKKKNAAKIKAPKVWSRHDFSKFRRWYITKNVKLEIEAEEVEDLEKDVENA